MVFVVMLWREELLERGVTAKCCGREGMESVTAWPVESDLTIRTTLLESAEKGERYSGWYFGYTLHWELLSQVTFFSAVSLSI